MLHATGSGLVIEPWGEPRDKVVLGPATFRRSNIAILVDGESGTFIEQCRAAPRATMRTVGEPHGDAQHFRTIDAHPGIAPGPTRTMALEAGALDRDLRLADYRSCAVEQW